AAGVEPAQDSCSAWSTTAPAGVYQRSSCPAPPAELEQPLVAELDSATRLSLIGHHFAMVDLDSGPSSPSTTALASRHRHLSAAERSARGKAARGQVPRSAHAAWEPRVDRPDPVVLLEQQAGGRIPELVPIRHGRMLASPFTFFRGAA